MQHIPGERYIEIGLQGEHDAREVQFDISGLIDRWPQAVWRLMYRRPGDTAPYPGETTSEEAVLTWHIQRRDVQTAGTGQYQLIGTQIGADGAEMLVAKSPIGTVLIHDSLGCEVPPPDAIVTWLEQIDKAAQAADASASAAEASATQAQNSAATAETLAQQASNSAQLAADRAVDAAYSALTAKEYAQTAGDSATKAEQSETRAQLSATAAQQYASQAQGSASAAAQSAASAQGDAGNALQSANSASAAASNASASANAAGNSAQQAASAADTARTDAATAQDAAQDAVEHASTAQKAAEAAENAAQEALGIIDDGVVARDSTWSSMGIVEKLCPPFEVTGNIVQCEPVEGSALDVTVEIVPTQEGTGDPSPENVRPIVGWNSVNIWRCGKNFCDGSLVEVGGYVGATGGTTNFLNRARIPKMVLPIQVAFKWSVPINYKIQNHFAYSSDGTMIRVLGSSPTVTLAKGEYYYAASFARTDDAEMGTDDIAALQVGLMLEISTMPTAYEPYRGDTFTIDLGQTVYGGRIDTKEKRAILKWKVITLTNSTLGISVYRETSVSIGRLLDFSAPEGGADGLCSHAVTSHSLTTSGMVYGWVSNNLYWINILSDLGLDNSSTNAFKQYLGDQEAAGTPVEVCVPLANPIIVSLDELYIPALSGANTLYADAGPVTVKGYSDPVTIVNRLSSRIAALEEAQTTI